jgi:hypothetical protein
MREPGANDELFPIIIESILSWDENMQKECAISFIQPIKNGLFTDKNNFKIIQKSINILNEYLQLPEHTEIVGPWVDLLGVVCTKVKAKDQRIELLPFLSELLNNKSPIEHRKVGNRILFAIAANIGEQGLNDEPTYVKLMKSVFVESNFKLRIDGIMFLKKYFADYPKVKELVQTDRFQCFYLPELIGYLEDGDQQLVCDAILAATPLLEYLEDSLIQEVYLPALV